MQTRCEPAREMRVGVQIYCMLDAEGMLHRREGQAVRIPETLVATPITLHPVQATLVR